MLDNGSVASFGSNYYSCAGQDEKTCENLPEPLLIEIPKEMGEIKEIISFWRISFFINKKNDIYFRGINSVDRFTKLDSPASYLHHFVGCNDDLFFQLSDFKWYSLAFKDSVQIYLKLVDLPYHLYFFEQISLSKMEEKRPITFLVAHEK